MIRHYFPVHLSALLPRERRTNKDGENQEAAKGSDNKLAREQESHERVSVVQTSGSLKINKRCGEATGAIAGVRRKLSPPIFRDEAHSTEHLTRIQVELAGAIYIGLQEHPRGDYLVLFQPKPRTSTLAVPLRGFSAESVRRRIRESEQEWEHEA